MNFLTGNIDRSKLVAGDHIYTWRTAYAYSHHGIYIGECKVIHFTDVSSTSTTPVSWCSSASSLNPSACAKTYCGFRQPTSGVVLSCLNCFLANGSLSRFEYGVSKYRIILTPRGGTCTTATSDPPEVVIHRATYLLEHGFGDYQVVRNNCEHFAMFCKTGLISIIGGSGQAFSFQVPFLAAGTYSVGRLIRGVGMVMTMASVVGTYFLGRYYNDFGVRVDVMKMPVEVLVIIRGSVRPPIPSDWSTNEATGSSAWFLTNVSFPTTTNRCSIVEHSTSEERKNVQLVNEGPVAATIDEQPINDAHANDFAERKDVQLVEEGSVTSTLEEQPTNVAHENDHVERRDVQLVDLGSVASTVAEIIRELEQPTNAAAHANDHVERTRNVQIVDERYMASSTLEEQPTNVARANDHDQLVDSGSVASTIDEIIRELEQPTNSAHANGLVEMDETLRSCAQTIKDKFVNKLIDMDPLAPREMIRLSNSCLKFLSQFPFDVDSLYFSVKNFIVQAYEVASAKRDVHSSNLDFNTQLERTRERIQVLTEERKSLEFLSSEAERALNAIDDQILRSQHPILERERESRDANFRNIQIELEQASKEHSDASNRMEELQLTAIFRSSVQARISAQLDDLEAALGEARDRLLS